MPSKTSPEEDGSQHLHPPQNNGTQSGQIHDAEKRSSSDPLLSDTILSPRSLPHPAPRLLNPFATTLSDESTAGETSSSTPQQGRTQQNGMRSESNDFNRRYDALKVTENEHKPNLRRSKTTFNSEGSIYETRVDNSVERQQAAWGAVAQQIINKLGKAERINGRLSLKEAVRFLLRVTRIRKCISGLYHASNLCKVCSDLELSVEKFLVRDRGQSLRENRFYREAPRQLQGTGKFEIGSGSGRYELGTLEHIGKKAVWCSFCLLVINSLREQRDFQWIDTSTIPDGRVPGEKQPCLSYICYASWQIDGRELSKNADGSVNSSIGRTRRIRLHWDRPNEIDESYLVMVAEPSLTSSHLFLGRRVETGRSNPALIKNWIDTCQKAHGEKCKIEHDDKFMRMIKQAYFGVIDVQDMCLSNLPEGAHYVALSYTWGDIPKPFTTTIANVRKLQAPRGIESVFSSLPRTIQDTIDLVRELGERYLWVDSICIVQDSTSSWKLNANSMDAIYGNAHFTICAADGDSPNAGLRGMDSKQRQFSQHMELYAPGLRLMASYLAKTYIQNSVWNTRAWTFQERLMSRRCVIFADSRVFFQCRSAAMREDVIAEEALGWSIEHALDPIETLDNLDTRALQIYMRSIQLYTSRQLTKPEDILDAFSGVGNLISNSLGAKTSLIWGLPATHFDFALLWEPKDAPEHRNLQKFPSWSWCGWKNQIIEYKPSLTDGPLIDIQDWLMHHTWIVWHIRDGHGNLKPVWNPSMETNRDQLPRGKWRGYREQPAEGHDIYGRPIRERERSSHDCFSKTLVEYPFGVIAADPLALPSASDMRFLQFFTWSAYLSLTDHALSEDARLGPNQKRYGIADYKGDWCGTIVLDKEWKARNRGVAEHEFVAISEAKAFAREEYESWMYYIPRERDQSAWDLYYVLLVEYRGEIAHRVGLGKVFKEAFANSCKEDKRWKEFILG